VTVQSPPLLLSAAGIVHPSRTFRQALGAMFRPAAAPLAAAAGAIYGPAGTMGETTLVTDVLLRVAPAVWIVNGSRNAKQGQYLVPNDESIDLAVPGKDAALSRRALIAVVVEDSQEDGTANTAANNEAFVTIVPGALAASNPALPAAPANSLLLGELSIPSTASGSPVTITRYDSRTVMRGGILPVIADGSNTPGHDGYPGQFVDEHRAHPTRGLERWSGAVWQPPQRVGFARLFAYATVARPGFTAGWQDVDLNAEDLDTHGAHTTGASLVTGQRYFTCPVGQAGRYSVEGGVTFDGATGGAQINSRVLKNNAVFRGGAGAGAVFGANGSSSITGTKILDLAEGNTVHIQGYCSSGWGTGVYTDGGSWMSVERID
jgi:hypothetical protein